MKCEYCNGEFSKLYMIEYKYFCFSKIIYFCSNQCIIKYEKECMCQNCKNRNNNFILIDGCRVCSDDSKMIEFCKPTCIQKYTGKYICNFCNKEKNAKINVCFVLRDYSTYLKKKDNVFFICDKCFEQHNKINYHYYKNLQLKNNDAWFDIIDDELYNNFMKLK
jgi:hypothetical protein